jgi:hypothetical protein
MGWRFIAWVGALLHGLAHYLTGAVLVWRFIGLWPLLGWRFIGLALYLFDFI